MTNNEIIEFLKKELAIKPRKKYKEPTTQYITIRLTENDLDKLCEIAEARDIPITAVAREFIKKGLKKHQ